jgi:nicotinate-nucleotide adenylyltransferase
MTTRHICLFGGSFNPPHVCHVMAATWALSVLPVDELWWIPTWQHAFGKRLESYEHRLHMTHLALLGTSSRMRVSDIEATLGGQSRTIRTVDALSERHPDVRWSLLVGSDLVDQMPTWQQWDRLRTLVDVYVIGRWGSCTPGIDSGFALPALSSTEIRDALRRDDQAWLATRMPRRVLEYIHEHRLYHD